MGKLNSYVFRLAFVLSFGILSLSNSYSQIFTESMGTVGGTTTLSAHETANGFDNDSYTMDQGAATNPCDIRATSVSTGYAGASGGANVWFTNTAGEYGFAIKGISASGCTGLTLSFGVRKEGSSGTAFATLALEYSPDAGANWYSLTYTPPATASGAGWYLISGVALPIGAQVNNLWIRWRKTGSIACRLDDVILTGTCTTTSITTSAIAGSPFSVTCTAGTALNVDFTSIGTFSAGNVYSAELSNASGSFALPTVIGTLSSTANAGTIACTIPANTATGTSYRIRVVSDNPVITGSDNGSNLTINLSGGACGITTSAISGSPFTVTCVAGTAVNVDFTSIGTFVAGNIYTAQLSDASGSFTVPTTIGTLTSTANAGTINATLPAGTTTGTGYRIRVISSTPFYSGSDNGSNLTINLSGGPCTTTITTGSITGSPFTVDCFTFQVITVPFTSNGIFNAGNIFRVQLSDASGSFSFPITIGEMSLSGVNPTSSIPSTILAGLTPGSAYRIRVVSTNPVTTGSNNGVNLTINNAGSPCYGPIIVNEISQGASGNYEYMEFLVIANDPCATMDIRNFVIDDNNGDFSGGPVSGVGIAAGHVRFTNSNQWANVPSGSLIVVYNNLQRGPSIPADDPSDLIVPDKVYILPVNSSLLEGCVTRPTSSDNSYSPCTYGVGDWAYISMANSADAAQVRYPNYTYSHGFSWGASPMNGGPDALNIGTGTTSATVIEFENTGSNSYTTASNFSRSAVPAGETPGSGNSAANTAYINTLICTALPVELTEFNVLKQESLNYVYWKTATETNTAFFVLERSTDMESFSEIARLDAVGNSAVPRSYSCIDDHPVAGYSYYRLRIVDLDGETQYSHIRMVYRSVESDSPILKGTTFDLTVCETGSLIRIFDSSGKLVEHSTSIGETYSIDHLHNGFYLVQILCGRNEYIFKTSIQK